MCFGVKRSDEASLMFCGPTLTSFRFFLQQICHWFWVWVWHLRSVHTAMNSDLFVCEPARWPGGDMESIMLTLNQVHGTGTSDPPDVRNLSDTFWFVHSHWDRLYVDNFIDMMVPNINILIGLFRVKVGGDYLNGHRTGDRIRSGQVAGPALPPCWLSLTLKEVRCLTTSLYEAAGCCRVTDVVNKIQSYINQLNLPH